jgi:hypothetical protein
MKLWGSRGYVLSTSVALALAGCDGSQAPIGAPGAVPQSRAIDTHAARARSWMLREAKGDDLVYVSASSGDVYIYSYPGLKEVGTITGLNANNTFGECSDNKGDVFVATNSAQRTGTIVEFTHGGTEPIAELSDPGYAWGCSVDPMTGNLAVSNYSDASNPSGGGSGDLAVYANAQGPPTMYYSTSIASLWYCGYDDGGNLFADGKGGSPGLFFELAKGSSSITEIALSGVTIAAPGAVQWDGKQMTLATDPYKPGPGVVYRLTLSGSSGTAVGTTELRSTKNRHGDTQSWIQSHSILGINYGNFSKSDVGSWKYPAGGKPLKSSSMVGDQLVGLTVSVAPSR